MYRFIWFIALAILFLVASSDIPRVFAISLFANPRSSLRYTAALTPSGIVPMNFNICLQEKSLSTFSSFENCSSRIFTGNTTSAIITAISVFCQRFYCLNFCVDLYYNKYSLKGVGFLDISKRLKEIRKAKNISVYKLSQLSGVSETHIRDLERGDRNPSIDTLSDR